MKRKLTEENKDNLRQEYDLGELLKTGIQGKYAGQYQEGTNIVLLDADVAEAFPNDEAVNEALRLVIKLTKVPRAKKGRTSKQSTP
jgi:hypothetical protein